MKNLLCIVLLVQVCASCAPRLEQAKEIPALEYANSIRAQNNPTQIVAYGNSEQPQINESDANEFTPDKNAIDTVSRKVPNEKEFFNTSLSIGQPGQRASLWREGVGREGLYHDFRAWKPLDLITIQISERSEGRKQADTIIDRESTFEAGLSNLLGIETSFGDRNPQATPSTLVNANLESQYQGLGQTLRRETLTGSISAMVAEVLPSGILRIEGKKVIAVNNEEQVMVITGLVRPRDINSNNEVQSAKVANMRIDYYGNGVVSEAQTPGFLARLLSKLWPF
jgi:flagellar L-ring protein FlgH